MLKTDRLTLRNLQIGDAAAICRYRGDARCNRYQRYADTGAAAIDAFIRRYAASSFLSREREQHYAVCEAGGGIVGDVSVFYTEKDRCFTLGVTIDYQYHRRGYAFEILSALVSALRANDPAEDVVALIARDNRASQALFEKLGFSQECYAESIASYVYVIKGTR